MRLRTAEAEERAVQLYHGEGVALANRGGARCGFGQFRPGR